MEHAAADLASRRSRGTADGEDVARFEAIAAEWWDPTGKFRPLHQLNPLRLAYIRDRLCERAGGGDVTAERPLAGLRILDVGCGGGLVSEGMASLGATVTGIDASATSIAVARIMPTKANSPSITSAPFPKIWPDRGRCSTQSWRWRLSSMWPISTPSSRRSRQ